MSARRRNPPTAGSDCADWADVGHAQAAGTPRIASWVPSLTETLYALELGDNVVARTGFCTHPRDAVRSVPKCGGTKNPDLVALRALAPTHLIVNVDENRLEDVDAARDFVADVIVTHPQGPLDNRRLYTLLGTIFDRRGNAAALTARFDDALRRLDAEAATLPRERVLYLIWNKPWMSVARDTYVSRTLARAGMDTLPVNATKRYPSLADDDPAWRDVERILLSTEPYAFRQRDADVLRARRGKPTLLIDGEWTSWYGVRAIDGLVALAAFRRSLVRPSPGTTAGAARNTP